LVFFVSKIFSKFNSSIFLKENGEHFVVGGRMFKKKNVNEHCIKSLSSNFSMLILYSSTLHYRKLFYANEIFQGILIHVKAMSEVYYYGQTNRVKPFCLLDRYAYQETLTLQEFSRRQFAQMNLTLSKLIQFVDQVAVLAADACQVNLRETEFF
jgi:hypothetical protein